MALWGDKVPQHRRCNTTLDSSTISTVVKVNKSRLTAYDFASREAVDVSGIAYEGQELVMLPPRQAFTCFGIRISLAGPPFDLLHR
jgi:hypothetical protein